MDKIAKDKGSARFRSSIRIKVGQTWDNKKQEVNKNKLTDNKFQITNQSDLLIVIHRSMPRRLT